MSSQSQSPSPTSSSSASVSASSSSKCHDPLESMVSYPEYDKLSYHSPSMDSKSQFSSRAVSNTPATLPPNNTQPDLSGPSHNYAMYKQQTGLPQGAVASTLAINQMNQFAFNHDAYLSGYTSDDFVDFATAPPNSTGFDDMDFDAAPKPEPGFFFAESSPAEFINPQTTLAVQSSLPAPANNVGRVWPGMHQQQAALAKAQAQQKQQQQQHIIQQQQQQQRQNPTGAPSKRPRAATVTDPLVEEKISQLLNSMRHGSVGSDDSAHGNMSRIQRQRKDEEEMDEDERLLASEEGKKLSSKERRQLRNKVSARAFRSRRKEYIGQLEGEIAIKVNENTDLRNQNKALMEENTRLTDLTRMLLSHPSFSGFLDTLAANPAAAQTAQAAIQPPPAPVEQAQRPRKDVNPYAGQSQVPPPQQQHIGMTMIPEQPMDLSMLDFNHFSYQPQVFSVLSLPEAAIDTAVLSGKSSPFSPLASDSEKVELPMIERVPGPPPAAIELPVVADAEFDADPAFALFTDSAPAVETIPSPSPALKEIDLGYLDHLSYKPAQFELVTAVDADAAMCRVERLTREMDACVARLTALTMHL